jgi:hypothetical protein
MKLSLPRLPKSIKVAYKTYQIVELTDVESEQHRASGQTMHLLGRITINLGTGTREAAETLQHEILHAVWSLWKISRDGVKEEDAIGPLACGLSTVWRDNPDVLAWIGHHIQHGT